MRARPTTIRSLLIGGIALCAIAAPIANIPVLPAVAQAVSVSVEIHTALEPYGTWQQHRRWGEVWIPSRVARDWEPYTVGHWVYSQDYGWYWVSEDEEADWGLVTYHYGRWAFDDEFGWMWIPGNEWGPGWVLWRHGRQNVGWEPLPPDEVIVEYRERPQFWIFVRERDLVAPRLTDVILPLREREVFFRETVVVNRTVALEDRRFAVNPGIPPTYIAAAYGRPIPSFDVRPRVLVGTSNPPGAVVVRGEDFRNRERIREISRESTFVRQSTTTVQPARDMPPLQALGANERGRLGTLPPRAAQPGGATTGQNRPQGPNVPSTQGAAPRTGETPNRPVSPREPVSPQEGAAPGQPPQQQGAAPGQRPPQNAVPGQPLQQQGREGRPATQGAAPGPGAPGELRGDQGEQRNLREGRRPAPNAPGAAPAAPSTSGAAPGAQRNPGALRNEVPPDVRGNQPQRDQRNPQEGRPGFSSPNAPSTSGEAPRAPQVGPPSERGPRNSAPGLERAGPEGRALEEREGRRPGNVPGRELGPSTSGAAPGGRQGGSERELPNRPPVAAPPQEPRGRERFEPPRSEGPGPRNLGGERGEQRPSAAERAPSPGLEAPRSRAPEARPQSPTTGVAPGGGRVPPGGPVRRDQP